MAIWTSASGATSVCGATFSITRGVASAADESADSDSADDEDEDEEDDDDSDAPLGEEGALLLVPDVALALEVGATSPGDGGGAVEPLVVTGLDIVGLFVVDVTGGGVLDGAAVVAAVVGAMGAGARV
ncbi:MAG TPA: hypothetical protein VET27_26735 [Mycobacterium sp.]|nr:hypothetical protein [Mycobacterium sp.]